MEDEIFDEPRRCPKCNVVTYCDSCPICGKVLPRSSKSAWKLTHRNHVAGEGEEILQPDDYEHHRGHIQQREIKRKISKSSYFQKVDSFTDTFQQKEESFKGMKEEGNPNNYRYGPRKQTYNQKNPKSAAIWIVGIIAMMIGAVVIFTNVEWNENTPDQTYVRLPSQIGSIQDNRGDIELYEYEYSYLNEESTVSICNVGNRAFNGELILYDKDGSEIGSYPDLYVLPYEDFEISLYTTEEASEYEFIDTIFYDIITPEPDFYFTTFNDYGSVDVNVDDIISEDQMIQLVKYLYEATSYSEYDIMAACNIYMYDDSSYIIYLDNASSKVEAEVYYYDEYGDIISTFTFDVLGSSTQGVSL